MTRTAQSSGESAEPLPPIAPAPYEDTAYKYGFVTDIETDTVPRGLNEDTIRMISEKKNEPSWMLDYRMKAYRHWLTMTEPVWANVKYPPIDFQNIIYFSAPKKKPSGGRRSASVERISILNCSKHSSAWAFRCRNKNASAALPLMPYLTQFQWAQLTKLISKK